MNPIIDKIVKVFGVSAIVVQVGLIGYSIGKWEEFWDEIDLRISIAQASSFKYTDNSIEELDKIAIVQNKAFVDQLTRVETDIGLIKGVILRERK